MKDAFAYITLLMCTTLFLNAESDHGQVILVQTPVAEKPEMNPDLLLKSLEGLDYAPNNAGQKAADAQLAHNEELARTGNEQDAKAAGYRTLGTSVERDARDSLRKNDAKRYVLLHSAAEGLNTRSNALLNNYSDETAARLAIKREEDVMNATTTVTTADGKTTDLTKGQERREMKKLTAARRKAQNEDLKATIKAARAAKRAEPKAYTPYNPKAK